MPVKEFQLKSGLVIKVYKRRSSRQLRLLIDNDNNVKVSIPAWTPYQAGLRFAKAKEDWIKARLNPKRQFRSGDQIGKYHHLVFQPTKASKVTSRLNDQRVVIRLPASFSATSADAQQAASRASLRALRVEANQLLIPRIQSLSEQHGFKYSGLRLKPIKSRWGSCDSKGQITLSLYLMLLPWPLIDYVLLHELTHLKHQNHSRAFWTSLAEYLPDFKAARRELKSYRSSLSV